MCLRSESLKKMMATQVLNGVEIFPVKVNKHKLGLARALCWDDYRLYFSTEKDKLSSFNLNSDLMW